MEDKQTKLTESQLGDVVDTLKNNVPKVIERQRKVALEAKPEDKLIEHIVQATVNPESGELSFDVANTENDSESLTEYLDKDDTADHIRNLKISDKAYKEFTDQFNFDEQEELEFINMLKTVKEAKENNTKIKDYYSILTKTFKKMAAELANNIMAADRKVPRVIALNNASKDLVEFLLSSPIINQEVDDLNAMIKKEFNIPNVEELQNESLRETYCEKLPKLADDLEAKLETIEDPELKEKQIKKIETLRNMTKVFKDTYELTSMEEFIKTHASFIRKLPKELKRYERFVTHFNHKYENSKFNIYRCELIVNTMLRTLEPEININDALMYLIVFCEMCKNMSPENAIEHMFMRYSIDNILAWDITNAGASEFAEALKVRVKEIIDLIRAGQKTTNK